MTGIEFPSAFMEILTMRFLFASASALAVCLMASSAFAQVAAPPPNMQQACDLQPVLLGEACQGVLDSFAQTGADPTSNLPAGTPLAGDLVMSSPAWAKAIVIRIGRKNSAVSMAWAAGASQNWDAYNYDPATASAPVASAAPAPAPQAAAQPAPATSTAPAPATQTVTTTASPDPATSTSDPNAQATAAPATQGADGAAAPSSTDGNASVAVQPTQQPVPDKLFPGWINDVSSSDALTVLGTFFDQRSLVTTKDMTVILPVRNAFDAPLMLTKTAKLVMPADGDILITAEINSPDTERPESVAAEKPTKCSVGVFVDNSPAIDTQPGVLQKVTSSVLKFASPPVNIPAGVHDVVAHFTCDDRTIIEQTYRQGLADAFNKSTSTVAYGYSINIVDAASGKPVLVGVTQADKDTALAGPVPNKFAIPNIRFTLPAGYETGWVASTPAFAGKLPSDSDLMDFKLQWPAAGGQTYPVSVPANGYKFDWANKLITLDTDDIVNHLIELDGIFSAPDSGEYVFATAIEPDQKAAFCKSWNRATESRWNSALNEVVRWNSMDFNMGGSDDLLPLLGMVRVEDEIRPIQPMRSLAFCYAEPNHDSIASSFSSVSSISSASFQMKAGSAYRVGLLYMLPAKLGTVANSKDRHSYNNGNVKIMVKGPKDKVLRPLMAYEILHQTGG